MARMSKIEQARWDGFNRACRVAKEQGVDGLLEEQKRRGISGFSVAIPEADLMAQMEEWKRNILQTVLLMTAATLRDEFDFGAKRMSGFNNVKMQTYSSKVFDGKHYIELYIPARTCFVLKEKVILPPPEVKEEPKEEKTKAPRKRTAKKEAPEAAATPAAEEKPKSKRTAKKAEDTAAAEEAPKKTTTRKRTTKKAEAAE